MTTITVQPKLSLTTLLNSLKQLTSNELKEIMQQTALLRARRLAPSLPQQEAQLLFKINQGIIPAETRARCAELTKKSRQDNITNEEQDELMALVDEIEMLNAKRIEYLAQLAQLRQTTLSALMGDLELKPLSYV